MHRSLVLWLLAIAITLGSAAYQRMTGPSYPVSGTAVVDGSEIEFEFATSHVTDDDYSLVFEVPDSGVAGEVRFRRFRSHDLWSSIPLMRSGDTLAARIPRQPAAGKVMYEVVLWGVDGEKQPLTEAPVIIRFRDPVPPYVLVPHVLCMFGAMLLSTRTGLAAAFKRPGAKTLALWTVGLLVVGGIILGPIVQKFAFGAYWTGWPVGTDLTDNKTAVALIFWLIAVWRARSGSARRWMIVASLVTLVVFLIPHSLLGSELDYTAGDGAS